MTLEVVRKEYGDVYVTKPGDDGMTVAELVEALSHMPQDARVRRYAEEWGVHQVRYEYPGDVVDFTY